MNFTGLLLKESLEDEGVLDLVNITKTETWDVDNVDDWQPKVWTAIYFKGDEKQIDDIAQKMSQAIKPRWYLNISIENNNKKTEYVIFRNKTFKYEKGDKEKSKQAKEYGRSLGIPESQLDGM